MERPHSEVDSYAGPDRPSENRFLIESYGRCPAGYPLYRLVHAGYLFEKIGGEWKDWDESITSSERGKMVADASGTGLAPDSEPLATRIEVRRSPKYPELPLRGWIVERWMPPSFYGTPELWFSPEFMVEGTSVPRLGPFPSRGCYLRITEPFDEPPGLGMIGRQIEYWQAEMENILSRSPQAHLRQRMYEEEQREELRKARWEAKATGLMSAMDQVVFSTSREAGQARGRAARRIGIHSHVG